jgi:hypothetical protein
LWAAVLRLSKDEGWPRALPSKLPSFETRAQARAPQDEGRIFLHPTLKPLIRRGGVYGKRVDTGFEFVSERFIDHAMTSDPALPPERVSYDINSEMRLAAGSMSGVAFMLVGFVEHLQAQRSEGLGELPRNGFLHTHRERTAQGEVRCLHVNRHPC